LLETAHSYKWIHPNRKGDFPLHGKSSGDTNEILLCNADFNGAFGKFLR
jgi:hypothetical protein